MYMPTISFDFDNNDDWRRFPSIQSDSPSYLLDMLGKMSHHSSPLTISSSDNRRFYRTAFPRPAPYGTSNINPKTLLVTTKQST